MSPKIPEYKARGGLAMLTTTPIVMSISVILIFLMGVSIYFTAEKIEAESNTREIQLIQNGLKIEISRVNGGVESQTLWDDAVDSRQSIR